MTLKVEVEGWVLNIVLKGGSKMGWLKLGHHGGDVGFLVVVVEEVVLAVATFDEHLDI